MKTLGFRVFNKETKQMAGVAGFDLQKGVVRAIVRIVFDTTAPNKLRPIVEDWDASKCYMMFQLISALSQKGQPIFEADICELAVPTGFGSFTQEFAVVIYSEKEYSFIFQGRNSEQDVDIKYNEELGIVQVVGDALRNPELLEKYHLDYPDMEVKKV